MELCGLFGLSDIDKMPTRTFLSVEFDRLKPDEPKDTPIFSRLVVLRREANKVSKVQSIGFKDSSDNVTASFALLPSGNVLCAMRHWESVYELQRSSSPNQFHEQLKAHQMAARVDQICAGNSGAEWRLICLHEDGSVHFYSMNSTRNQLEHIENLDLVAHTIGLKDLSSWALEASHLFTAHTKHKTTCVEFLSFESSDDYSRSPLVEYSGSLSLLYARRLCGRVALVAFDVDECLLLVYELDQ